ncbi:hypothetical protein N7481_002626 [Penicillium waksmanii]|uniref:uncharacterized protein n=1 Tax=Penicillium waksmanii TaxID=69791 RepID=UPI002548A792|nr:uncharacterized protein N7481_002626 [Penicillium waksmanii]KAJ5995649.1 hypothetical protein N7481_002626 [Penicillium waksmanii]
MRFSVYLHLANSIIREFRMDQPTKLRALRERLDIMECPEPPAKSISTQNQEMRALIGYFFLDSTHTVISQRTGTMPWSQFIESCAEKLSQECEFPADRYLLGQVRLQHMLERIDSLVRRGFSESQARPADIEAIVRSLQSDAQECKAHFPINTALDRDLTIGIQSHTFEIHLHQTVVFDVFPASTISIDQSAALIRVDALCHGLAAAKQCLDWYYELPVGIEKKFSYSQWTSIGFCVAASCKLVLASLEPTVRHHDQVMGLREALNMRGEIQKLIQRMNTIDQECKGEKWDQHEIFFYKEWLQHLGEWFEAQYRLAHSDSAGENNNGIVFASGISDNNIYDPDEPDAGFPWLNLQDVTIEEMLNAWLGPAGMY